MFNPEDFPIGSNLYFYKLANIELNPLARKLGSKRYGQGYVFSKLKITHHIKGKDYYLIGVEGDNSDEGYDLNNSRIKEGFFIIPEWLFNELKGHKQDISLNSEQKVRNLLNYGTGFPELNSIIRQTNIEVKRYQNKVSWYKNR